MSTLGTIRQKKIFRRTFFLSFIYRMLPPGVNREILGPLTKCQLDPLLSDFTYNFAYLGATVKSRGTWICQAPLMPRLPPQNTQGKFHRNVMIAKMQIWNVSRHFKDPAIFCNGLSYLGLWGYGGYRRQAGNDPGWAHNPSQGHSHTIHSHVHTCGQFQST